MTRRIRHWVVAVLMGVPAGACARVDEQAPADLNATTAYPSVGDLPPYRRAPPTAPFSADRALLADRATEALERYDRGRWERFVDAVDPGELSSDLRVDQSAIDRGLWKREWIFLLGDELFEHDMTDADGFGPGLSRVHRGKTGGPDALSCAECHRRGGFDGAGEMSQNAFFDGDGTDPYSGFERNAPHTLGMGIVQRLAEEMTADLRQPRDYALLTARQNGKPSTFELRSKGISFGRVTGLPDGSLDTSEVVGVDADLVVKPFGWKGNVATLRDFVADGFQRHHGVQLAEAKLPGRGTPWDRDQDGSPNELLDGMVTAMVTYLSLLEIPVMIPPIDPELRSAHGRGAARFESIGCASCHVPALTLGKAILEIGKGLQVDLFVDGEAPRPRTDAFDRDAVPIFLFSDLKRHAMGPGLADRRDHPSGVPADQFLTRPLWGLADTGPWLHDGRAATLDDAILLHGGEAQDERDAFERLPPGAKAELRVFLTSLTRLPRIDYR